MQSTFANLINARKVCSAFVTWLKPRVGISLLLLL